MLTSGSAHAHADNAGLADTVSIAGDVLDTVGDFYCGKASVKNAYGAQDNIGPWRHTAIAVNMGAGGNATGVSAVGAGAVIQ